MQRASPIKDVLASVISSISGEKKTKLERLKKTWDSVVDKKTRRHASPASFKTNPHSGAGRLVVNIDSSAWMYQMNLSKDQLKQKLNKKLADDKKLKIEEIILRIGETS